MKKNNDNRRMLILTAFTIVITVFWIAVGKQASPDEMSYLKAWESFSAGHIDMERTPVYPFIIGMARWIAGENHMTTVIIMIQSIIATIAVFYAYRIALRATGSERAAFWIAIAIAFIPDMVAWRNSVMTESLAMSGSIFLIFCTIGIVDGRSRWNILGFALWLSFLVYLRPSFVYMLPVLTVLLAWTIWRRRKLWKRAAAAIGIIAAVSVSLLAYCHTFQRTYGLFAPTSIALENEFYDMRQAGTLDPEKAENKALGRFIADTYRKNGTELYQYSYCPILWADLDYVIKHWSVKDIRQVVDASRTPQNVIKGIAVRTYYAGRDAMVYPRATSLSEMFNFTIGWVYLLLAVYIVRLFCEWKRKGDVSWISVFLLFLSAANLAAAVVGAFGQNVGEWGRLIYPSKFIYIILLVQLVLSLKHNIETRYKRNN